MRSIPVVLLALALLRCVAPTPAARPHPEPFDQPDEAEQYYRMKREVPAGQNPQDLYDAARTRMSQMRKSRLAEDASSETTQWNFLGPGNIGGRTRALVVDPRNPDTLYAGGVSGGIYKTTNGGVMWTPIGDNLANLAVNSMAMNPDDSNILYAGTGEGYFREEVRGTALPLRGNGIFRTSDGGANWQQLPSTANSNFYWVNDLVVSEHDPRRVYAATRTGVWRSNDEGATWTRILVSTVKGGCLDLALRNDTPGDYLFASCGVFQQASIFRQTNAETDAAWTNVYSEPGMSRTSLAIAPSNPSVIYALAASNDPGPGGHFEQGLQAVFRSDRSGDPGTWVAVNRNTDTNKLDTMLLTNPISSAPGCPGSFATYVTLGWHCNVIAVDPVNPDTVWAAGIDLFRSDDGGKTWGLASYWWTNPSRPSFVHADQHAIVFHPQYDGITNQTVFVANDGGVYRSENAGAAVAYGLGSVCDDSAASVVWSSLNHNYGATQFYHGVAFPDGKRYFGGAQDNGTLLGRVERSSDDWERIWGGDGGYVAVDPTNSNIIYAESQGGRIVKSADGGATWGYALNGLPPEDFLFIAPFLIDPNRTVRLWIGGGQMYRTDDGGSFWVRASTRFPATVSAVAVAPGNPDLVIAGLNNGAIARTESATTATQTTAWPMTAPRGGFVSSLTFDPTRTNIAYATYAGFGGGAHVWKSTDSGATWTAIDGAGDGTLPDIPMHSLAVDPTRPDRLFLGTDLGVFASTDGGGHWYPETSGLPAVITEAVSIGQGALGPAVYAFTHGRGAWRAELTSGPPPRRRGVRR